jgi:hypothetical protein
MILIYSQFTVDYIHTISPELVMNIETNYGKPEIKEFFSAKGNNIRYYKFELDKHKRKSKKHGT